jgi:hypothetical protein
MAAVLVRKFATPEREVFDRFTLSTDHSQGALWTSCYRGAYGSNEKGCIASATDRATVFRYSRSLVVAGSQSFCL